MTSYKPVDTLIKESLKYTKDMMPITPQEQIHMQSIPYSNAIGNLQYLIIGIRPHIIYAINHLAQFMANPRHKLWSRVK